MHLSIYSDRRPVLRIVDGVSRPVKAEPSEEKLLPIKGEEIERKPMSLEGVMIKNAEREVAKPDPEESKWEGKAEGSANGVTPDAGECELPACMCRLVRLNLGGTVWTVPIRPIVYGRAAKYELAKAQEGWGMGQKLKEMTGWDEEEEEAYEDREYEPSEGDEESEGKEY